MNTELLSRAECSALRGLAIIGIFLHNYCHWLGPVVKENEYQYFQKNVDWLNAVTASPDMLLPAHLISFFGHYGVPIFLFLSAFGLERKYGTTGQQQPSLAGENRGGFADACHFIVRHWKKLFRMMIVGFICFTIVDAITPGRWHYTMTQVLTQLGMVNNLLSDPDHNIWPGPYWFFGLMVQLYIVYRLVMYRRHWGWTVGLMAVCLAVQLALPPESAELNWYRYNFMGGMLPFGLGLLFARYGNRVILTNLNLPGLLMSCVVCAILVGWLNESFIGWSLVPLLVCITCVYFVKLVSRLTPVGFFRWLFDGLVWIGNISAALFIIHPVLRKIFIPISRQGDLYTGLLLYIIASIGVARVLQGYLNSPKKKQATIQELNPHIHA